jgi:thymidine phosphorylase
MAAALGGPADLVERPEKHLPRAAVERPVEVDRRGFIARIDVRAVGLAILALGGGRRGVEDRIDYSVGLADMRGIGDDVGPGRPLAIVHARDAAAAEQAAAAIGAAVELADAPVAAGPLIRDRIAGA